MVCGNPTIVARMRRPQNFTLLVLIGIVIDHTTKFLVFKNLKAGQVIVVIENWLEIRPEQNFGVAFSMFRNHTALILGVSTFALALISLIYIRIWRTAHPLMIWALGLLLVGAIGNLIDRVVFSFVRDFIDFVHPLPLVEHWAVFNFADICITVGVILFLISEIFYRETPAAKTATSSTGATGTASVATVPPTELPPAPEAPADSSPKAAP